MLRNKIALAAAGFVAGVAMTLATVGLAPSPVAADQADNAYMMAQKAQVAHATYMLDNAGLHGLAESAHAGTIPPGMLGKVRTARIATQATDWPEALKPMATDMVTNMKSLEEALRTEDPAKVADVVDKAHDGGHDLSSAVYAWLETGAAPAPGGHGH
ncbi:MAG: hypothetical protein U0893_17470 [Chloroflexota bacterium]